MILRPFSRAETIKSSSTAPASTAPPQPSSAPAASVPAAPVSVASTPASSASTSAPAQTPVADPVDISEFTISEENISLSAQTNSDDTITYIYTDISVKPVYVSDGEVSYNFTVYGTNSASNPITITNFSLSSQKQDDGTYITDMASLMGSDTTIGEPPIVTVDSNGLTITWKSGAAGNEGLQNLGAFFIGYGLRVGGESVSSGQFDFGIDILV